MPVIILTAPALGVRSITAQLASSKPGLAHTGEPLTQGESPGENFHGPVSATAESPRATTCAGAGGAGCAQPVPCEETDRSPSRKTIQAMRMAARLPLAPIPSDNGLKRLRRYVPARPEVRHDRTMDGEEFRDLLLIRASCIPSAHGHILFIRRGVPGRISLTRSRVVGINRGSASPLAIMHSSRWVQSPRILANAIILA